MSSPLVSVSSDTVHRFAIDLLLRNGVPQDRAEMVANGLVLADLRGIDTHGINRLPGYLARVKSGVLDPNPPLHFKQATPVMASLDAANTFGMVAGSIAIDKAIEMARTYGMGMVSVKHSNHFGMAATYLLRAIDARLGAFAFTNASRAMPAWGGKEPLLGTGPMAIGLPGGAEGNFVLDMSPTVAARGKIRKAARRNEPIPEGFALDAEGRPTTDPVAALGGVMLPIAGPKGSGLATMIDMFGGVISGANFGGDVPDQYKVLDKEANVGHWFMVFRPEIFLDEGWDEYVGRMDELLRRIRSSEKAAGVERIWTAGEIEADQETRRRKDGIPLTRAEIEALEAVAKEYGSDAKLGAV